MSEAVLHADDDRPEIDFGAVYKTAYTVRVGSWAQEPCWRCARQPQAGEPIHLDWMAQTVTCGVCVKADQRALAEMMRKMWRPEQSDGTVSTHE